MKIRNALLFISLIGLSFFLAAGLSSTKAIDNPPHNIFLPLIDNNSALLYWDDFSDPNSGWPIFEERDVHNDVIVKWSYQNGEYEMLIPKLKEYELGRWASAFAPVRGFDRYVVAAEMHRSLGDVSEYGLVFDQKDLDNYYIFVVNPGNQRFAVIKRELVEPGKVEWEYIIEYTTAAVINPDDETNHLRVIKNGDEITVFVNSVLLATANDQGFNDDPGVGLFIVMKEEVPASVRYDNFEVLRVGSVNSQPLRIGPAEASAENRVSFGSDFRWTSQN